MIRHLECTFTSTSQDRVDKAASSFISRSVFSRADSEIYVNGVKVKKSYRLKEGDEVLIKYSEEFFERLTGEDIPLDILYEDEAMLVINKETGLVVHPGSGNYSHTLVNALIYRYGDEFATSEDDEVNLLRPGIVHRLDKDTSGVLVVAKSAKAHENLASQFASHSNEKYYLALVKGTFNKTEGTIDKALVRSTKDRKLFETTEIEGKGKRAVTHYKVLYQSDKFAFLLIKIETGRTHQIRVHMKSIGHPVLGDELYSSPVSYYNGALALHSYRLIIDHPITGERMSFTAPIPTRIKEVLPLSAYQEV